jgi:hypothetical protein
MGRRARPRGRSDRARAVWRGNARSSKSYRADGHDTTSQEHFSPRCKHREHLTRLVVRNLP